MEAFNKCFHQGTLTPEAIRLDKIVNFSGWLGPHINDIHHQSQPHAFKIIRNEEGKAVLLWKKFAADKVSFCVQKKEKLKVDIILKKCYTGGCDKNN